MDHDAVAQAHHLLRRGDVGAAIRHLVPALDASASRPQSLRLLARLALHQQDTALASRTLQAALAASPDDAELHALRAAAAKIAGDPDALEGAARRAVALDPGEPLATALLTEALRERLQVGEAIEVASACLARRPDDWGTRLARADALQFAGEAEAAERDARHAAGTGGSLQAVQMACSTLLYLDEPAPDTPAGAARPDAATVLARHRELAAAIPPLRLPPPPRGGDAPGTRPLRVALLSPDLRRHPVGQFVEPLLAAWDRERIRPFCYSDGVPDAASARLRARCNDWRDIRGEHDMRVIQRLREDRIDVLVDLAGHTHGSRPQVLASRCVPRQFGYLGYLFDTGFETCDGIIGDAFNLPPATRSARRPLRLPGSFLCYSPSADAPAVAARAARGERVFGSFNHLAKLSTRTIALWTRTVLAVPGARLVLCALGLADPATRERIQARFAEAGLPGGRLELRPPVTSSLPAFLAQYADVDIALDPLPFNGGTTTLQALWQGVPVLTLPGQRMAARSGLSILAAAGLSDWVAETEDDFVNRACHLADDGQARIAWRRGLRDRLRDAGSCDAGRFADRFARLLEDAVGA
ncbi:tetratricopeptide repeat protein [Marilutibacter spongiae]|uniref:Tetratricopeptide repeat protein n=1 Tax=Marilutibacter spongiae TaxID=2025720 RepID=A0A7W3Y6Y6_9GAMM|nr:tetratricopeptide repeat protein [Lysobacter spongiae]MBB1061727.1 tetratricopeptide repeat protein [Lysobacter spongiae]